MLKIDPHTLYDSKELKEILHGFVKLESLREFGLVGLPGKGYWGQNVIDSLTKLCQHLACQRGTGKVKENHLDKKPEFFEKRSEQIQNRQVHATSRKAGPVESQRQRFQRQVSPDSV